LPSWCRVLIRSLSRRRLPRVSPARSARLTPPSLPPACQQCLGLAAGPAPSAKTRAIWCHLALAACRDTSDQPFIDYGVVIVAPVARRFLPSDAVVSVLFVEYERHRASPSLPGSSQSAQDFGKAFRHLFSYDVRAYIRRSSRPIARMVPSGSAGAGSFWFSLLIDDRQRLECACALCGARHRRGSRLTRGAGSRRENNAIHRAIFHQGATEHLRHQ
jgi:hypothetical protein